MVRDSTDGIGPEVLGAADWKASRRGPDRNLDATRLLCAVVWIGWTTGLPRCLQYSRVLLHVLEYEF